MTDQSFQNRITLVTGASRGIGRAVALDLAARGAHVVALARTSGALEELDDEIQAAGGAPATLIPVDLREGAAIDRLGPVLYERFGKLDLLVANAGVLGELTPLSDLEEKVWDRTMAVNVTANWRLIRTLDPILRRAEAARATFVSSAAAWKRRAYWGPYAVSKAALNQLVWTYAEEIATTPIRVSLIDPGPARTRMRAEAMPGEDPMTLPTPEEIAPMILEALSPDYDGRAETFVFREWQEKAAG